MCDKNTERNTEDLKKSLRWALETLDKMVHISDAGAYVWAGGSYEVKGYSERRDEAESVLNR